MTPFDVLLAQYTKKGDAKVHGVYAICVDGNGKEIYSKISGFSSVSATAEPLQESAVFKLASATKLITTIALLQCIERSLIGLDSPVSDHLPELANKRILSLSPSGELVSTPSTTPITPRHLLTHTSGLAYWFHDPLLIKWRATRSGQRMQASERSEDRYNHPLIFEPGDGWSYGTSLDWAGILVARLTHASLEDYCIQRIWAPLGLGSPFPTFDLSAAPAYRARLMRAAERSSQSDELGHCHFRQGDDGGFQAGGHGLSCTAADFAAVLSDLVAPAPKLLRPETAEAMFAPQMAPGHAGNGMLAALRPAWEVVAGPVEDGQINWGYGGALVTAPCEEVKQPGGVLCWGGATNVYWWACREKGVAGFFATQLQPFADPRVRELVEAWKRDFWEQWAARE